MSNAAYGSRGKAWTRGRPAASATTTLKSGRGTLHTVTINTTAAAAVTIYDNTAGSGTTIAVFQASAGLGTYWFDVPFTTGLTFVLAGAHDITVAYE